MRTQKFWERTLWMEDEFAYEISPQLVERVIATLQIDRVDYYQVGKNIRMQERLTAQEQRVLPFSQSQLNHLIAVTMLLSWSLFHC
jgi:hypothetical protein